jgi:hypothetical protein
MRYESEAFPEVPGDPINDADSIVGGRGGLFALGLLQARAHPTA